MKTVHSLYLTTSNDASILRDVFDTNQAFVNLFRMNDCFVLDRGFRDVIQFLEKKNFSAKTPSIKKRNESQLNAQAANNSRLVTNIRWVVEAVHGIKV